jgi:hypothetical protein
LVKPENNKITHSPCAEQVNEEVAAELGSKHLRDDIQVRDESRLEDDGDVRRVEKLDGIAAVLATVTGRLNRQVHSESL